MRRSGSSASIVAAPVRSRDAASRRAPAIPVRERVRRDWADACTERLAARQRLEAQRAARRPHSIVIQPHMALSTSACPSRCGTAELALERRAARVAARQRAARGARGGTRSQPATAERARAASSARARRPAPGRTSAGPRRGGRRPARTDAARAARRSAAGGSSRSRRGERGAQVRRARRSSARDPAVVLAELGVGGRAALGEREVPRAMRGVEAGALAARASALRRVLADRLEQAVADWLARRSARRHERLVDEPRRGTSSGVAADADASAASRSKLAGEDRRAGGTAPARARRAGRGSSRASRAASAGGSSAVRLPPPSRSERVVEARGDLRGRERGDARGGQLDRQRDAVEAAADRRRRRRRCRRSSAKLGRGGRARSTNSAHRLGARAGRASSARQRERRHAPRDLAGDAQRLAARGQDAQARAAGAAAASASGAQRLDQVLAVVEHEQQLAWSPSARASASTGSRVGAAAATPSAGGRPARRRAPGRRAGRARRAAPSPPLHARRSLERQARLAAPARAR